MREDEYPTAKVLSFINTRKLNEYIEQVSGQVVHLNVVSAGSIIIIFANIVGYHGRYKTDSGLLAGN